jgi:threonine/homoserine/homoserine lactone efflux protein
MNMRTVFRKPLGRNANTDSSASHPREIIAVYFASALLNAYTNPTVTVFWLSRNSPVR